MRLKLWLGAVLLFVALGCVILFVGDDSAVGHVQVHTQLLSSLSTQILASSLFAITGGLLTALLALFIGIPLGVASGTFSGVYRSFFRTPIDILSSVPRYVLIVFLFSMYGKGLTALVIGCAIACAPTVAEAMRAHVAKQLAEGRFTAFHAHGLHPVRIVWVHFVFISGQRLILREALTIGGLFIVSEASLAYIDPFVYSGFSASWGMMLSRLIHAGQFDHVHTWLILGWMCTALLGIAVLRHGLERPQ